MEDIYKTGFWVPINPISPSKAPKTKTRDFDVDIIGILWLIKEMKD